MAFHSELEKKLRESISDYYFNEIKNENNSENDKWGFCDDELINDAKQWYIYYIYIIFI